MSFKSLITVLLFFFITSTALAASLDQTKIVIFGDSLSDIDNNTWAEDTGKTGAPFTNIDESTSTRPLWVNYFFEKKFPTQTILPSRIAEEQHIDLLGKNIDYAFASAETGDQYLNDHSGEIFPPYIDQVCHEAGQIAPGIYCVPGVLRQISTYLDAVHHPDSNTIFIIWAGGNDIFNNITKLVALLQFKKSNEFHSQLMNSLSLTPVMNTLPKLSTPVINLVRARDRLIEAGVNPNQIYFIDLPDLSKTPAATKLAGSSKLLLGAMHAITVSFNTSLKLALTKMPFSKNNLPESHIISIYDLLNTMMQNPQKYHFTHTTQSCVNDDATPYCTGYIFFNDKHPTTEAGKLIAEKVAETI